jgi:cation transport ATPase
MAKVALAHAATTTTIIPLVAALRPPAPPPLAAGVLARWGILLHPALGAILMSLSTVIVAINAQLLRRAV